MSILNSMLLPVADLEWYRNNLEDLSIDTFLIITITNDFEVIWFFSALILKNLSLGFVSFVIFFLYYLFYLLVVGKPHEEKTINSLSLYFLFPGIFLLTHNVIRQGVAEYVFILAFFKNSWVLLFLSILSHRSAVFCLPALILSKLKPNRFFYILIFVIIIGLFFLLKYKNLLFNDEKLDAYEKLDFSVLKLGLKIMSVLSVIFVLLILDIRYFKLFYRKYVFIFFILLFLIYIFYTINGRLADRVSFWLIPISIFFFSEIEISGQKKIWVSVFLLIISIAVLFLDSHIEFFF